MSTFASFHRSHRSFAASCALVLSTVASCSDTPTGGTTPLTAENFYTAYISAACSNLFRCPGTGDNAQVVALLQNEANCRTVAPLLAGREVPELLGFVSGGSVRFNGEIARSCLSAVQNSCAANSGDLLTLCAGAFVGTLGASAPCWRSEQCGADLYCDHGSGSPRRCPGVCSPRVALGTACTQNAQCVGSQNGSAQCGSSGAGTPVCVAVTEGPTASSGQPCGLIDGAPSRRVACSTGLVCARRICQMPLAAGAACTPGQACVSGYLCAPAPGAMTATCVAYEAFVRSTPGGACTSGGSSGGSGVFCNPLARLQCNAARTCEAIGDGTVGSRCIPGGDLNAASCNEGLRCDATTMTCARALAAGMMCQRGADCLSDECEGNVCLEHICQ